MRSISPIRVPTSGMSAIKPAIPDVTNAVNRCHVEMLFTG